MQRKNQPQIDADIPPDLRKSAFIRGWSVFFHAYARLSCFLCVFATLREFSLWFLGPYIDQTL
jgi:hypothetical protein